MLDRPSLTIQVAGETRDLARELEEIFYQGLVTLEDGRISVAYHLDQKYPSLNFDVLAAMFADNLGDREQTVKEYLRWHKQRQPVFDPVVKANLLQGNVLDFACQIDLMLRSESFRRHCYATEEELLAALCDLTYETFDCAQQGEPVTLSVRIAALACLLYERSLNPLLFDESAA